MRKILIAACAALLATGLLPPIMAEVTPTTVEKATQTRKPLVQLAILLDTSNSMDGLIDQARTQLWRIVNEFARASRDGVRPEIEVALYQYGTPSLGAETGYIKQLCPLTTDLDKVSEELFKLKTNGGDEYCGAVIKKAAEDLKWSADKGAYKAIFIAGNEPFDQGNVKFSESCKAAISQGIVVNTIYCGEEQQGVREKWKEGATLADGAYMAINQDKKVAHIDAPQDKEIAALNEKLNGTYLAFGDKGKAGEARQAVQDKNVAAAAPSASIERAAAKASGAYRNADWDLVDAAKDGKLDLKGLKKDELPKEMQGLDEKGQKEYIEKKAKERAEVQGKIRQLAAEREKYIAQKRKETGEKTLDAAVVDIVHQQAQRASLNFEEPKK